MDIFHIKQPVLRTIFNSSCPLQPCEQMPPFALLSDGKKRRLCLNCLIPLTSPQPKLLDYSILFSLDKWFFSKRDNPFIDKPILVITEPVEPSTRPLGLGSKTISQQRAMHASQKSYSIHAESFSCTPKSSNKQKKGSACRGPTSLILMLTTC